MTGEKDLDKLLGSLSPRLSDELFVFRTFPGARYGDYAELLPVAAVEETEGLTLVIPHHKQDDRGGNAESVFRRITLGVHSSLDAVGLTAVIATKLAEHGISANVVAGYYHDHIFVQADVAERAMRILADIAT